MWSTQITMNTLGLDYGSSSSSDEEIAPASVVGTAPATVEARVHVVEHVIKTDEAPAKPMEIAAEPSDPVHVGSVVTTESMVDGDEEAVLLRAGIPPAVAPLADNSETQQRIERFLRVQNERGQDFQTTLQDKKEVRNPYILEKVVEYFGIDELQSNLSPDVFDPHGLPLHEYADALALEQKKRADARAQRQLQRSGGDPRQLQFISANPANNAG
ncbi:hypothetical protein V7S43_003604 [Phytophthora oleae]|uniref:SAP30-binding protein n=1 Tax=Phytophthora oleae TaxID=2107226 RepID=A0ABD3G1A8_9STRA